MALQTYTIEMKVDTNDEAHEALAGLVKQSARDLLASAMLLSPGRAPQIIARTVVHNVHPATINRWANDAKRFGTDAFFSTEEIELLDVSGVAYE